jgi:hypothetical protein
VRTRRSKRYARSIARARGLPPNKQAACIVASGASLDANHAWRQLLEERQDVATLQLPADNHLADSINAMHLKY